ncbi:PhoU family transcriptional regulator [Candidatus Mycoplasma haematobovis]|uniref:PhoU family transcriptional regulator n=1 Tax=Candidatus Mycoplasma haematobovis TaxID=432608 RepID=A0A1A9QEW4_9MOLU|nr:PhoU domain-containing protein [Candidatus Mycoplasma haematobovis]OAL10230.1 PhoU family transcriptional regulator [Candidatus Mycoplasma haematobovis]
MAINAFLLEGVISDCFISFKAYFDLTYSLHKKVYDFYFQYQNKDLLQEIREIEFDVNSIQKRMAEEIVWNISQHTPQATDLRFFLAVLLSLKDLERFADYGFSIAQIINKQGKELSTVFKSFDIFSEMLKCIKEIWKEFIKCKGRINAIDLKQCSGIRNKFIEMQKHAFAKTSELVLVISEMNKDLPSFVHLVLVKLGRAMDHIFNVIENFCQAYFPDMENEDILNES